METSSQPQVLVSQQTRSNAAPEFDSIFQSAPTAPQPSLGRPLSTSELVYQLTASRPAAATRPTQPAVPPSLASSGYGWQPTIARATTVRPVVTRLETLRERMQRLETPQSTLDVRLTHTNRQLIDKAPAAPRHFGKVSSHRISQTLETFRAGELSWSQLETFCKAASRQVDRVAERLAIRGGELQADVIAALASLADALRAMQFGATKMDTRTVNDCEMRVLQSDVALSTARTAALGLL